MDAYELAALYEAPLVCILIRAVELRHILAGLPSYFCKYLLVARVAAVNHSVGNTLV
jgi:hypothetical protein